MTLGRFITFEGGEGAGKSTQVSALSQRLRDQGKTVISTREPGGSPAAEEIRTLLVQGEPDRWTPLTEALLHSAARHEHLEEVVRPALKEGSWVLCDRFYDSTMAYQGYAQGLGVEVVSRLAQIVVGPTHPDLTIVFDLPVEVGLERAKGRLDGDDRYERMGKKFHENLREAFREIAVANPDRCVVIDATPSEEDVAQKVWDIVRNRLLV